MHYSFFPQMNIVGRGEKDREKTIFLLSNEYMQKIDLYYEAPLNKDGLDIKLLHLTSQFNYISMYICTENHYEMYSQKSHFKSGNASRLNKYLSVLDCGRLFSGAITQSIYSYINNARINEV